MGTKHQGIKNFMLSFQVGTTAKIEVEDHILSQSVIDTKLTSPQERTKPNSILDIDIVDSKPEC